tara:strand:+ start:42169 stop:43002 length:834 start_codon:yes stop_codon:yes gene_type:complete
MNDSLNNLSYTHFNVDEDILHVIDNEYFLFDPTIKNIGVNLSGGADSACGTALLCKLITELECDTKITVITHNRCWKTRPWQQPVSIDVYNKLVAMFPNIIIRRIENFIPPELEHGVIGNIEQVGAPGDTVCVQSFNRYAMHTYDLDITYGFTTSNPQDENFSHPTALDKRNWTKEKLLSQQKCPQVNVEHITPFTLLDKTFIVKQYYNNNWTELLDITRSCEHEYDSTSWRKDFPTLKNYIHGTTPLVTCCDIIDDLSEGCFWCAERDWALTNVVN